MKLTVRTTHGDYTIADLSDSDALDVAEDFRDDTCRTMTFDMDGATVIIDRSRIVTLELDPEPGDE